MHEDVSLLERGFGVSACFFVEEKVCIQTLLRNMFYSLTKSSENGGQTAREALNKPEAMECT